MNRFDSKPRVNKLPLNPEGNERGRFPSWLHRKLPKGGDLFKTGQTVGKNRLHTVCEEAKCPNRLECYSRKTATFLVMGKECTRSCGFCEIDFAKAPKPLEADEPDRILDSVQKLGLKHVVITMVARDDLPDGGAAHLATIIKKLKDYTVEVLTSDFDGNLDALDLVLNENPTVFNHNLETVREKTPGVRHKATYDRSLTILRHAKGRAKYLKSGIMVGLGETEEQVHQTLHDLHDVGCDIVTLGQYLQPSRRKLTVKTFVTPEQFKAYEEYGRSIGIPNVYSGPFVRSSYNADLLI